MAQRRERLSISTHILDTALGRPVAGVAVSLARGSAAGEEWTLLHESVTDKDGRIKSLLPEEFRATDMPMTFRVRFETAAYFAAQGQSTLYPYIDIVFLYTGGTHYHIPLLLAAHGYTTYRGS